MITNAIHLILPEIYLLGFTCIVLLADVIRHRAVRNLAFILSLVAVVGSMLLVVGVKPAIAQQIFANSYVVDNFSSLLKFSILGILFLILIYSRAFLRERGLLRGEMLALLLLSSLGMMILVSSASFLTLYLGLELFVLPLYAVIAMDHQRTIYIESAIKYFVLGSLGAAILLYGISFVYGAVGDFSFVSLTNVTASPLVLKLGLLFILIGISLEFGAVPFHVWLPDVYQGSMTPVTMFIATLPKIAILGITYRIMSALGADSLNAWQYVLLLVGVFSIAYGNIVAISQTNLKRMLAYSTISHVGFILLGLFAAITQGYVAALVYTLIYALMSLAAFAWVTVLSAKHPEFENIADLAGLHHRSPTMAFAMLLIMVSLAGIPPMIGFYAKFLVLQAIVAAGYKLIATLALLFAVIGVFYYLRVIKVMYFNEPSSKHAIVIGRGITSGLVVINAMLLLLLGIVPGVVMTYSLIALQ